MGEQVAAPARVMRAKMQIQKIELVPGPGEVLHMSCVAASRYPEDGSDEDNTFAMFTPSGELRLHVNNPALIGKFKPGNKMYIDFTPA